MDINSMTHKPATAFEQIVAAAIFAFVIALASPVAVESDVVTSVSFVCVPLIDVSPG